jgi:hypothetical protein
MDKRGGGVVGGRGNQERDVFGKKTTQNELKVKSL